MEELRAWHAAIVDGAPVVNTLEDARADLALLGAIGRKAIG